MPALLYLLFFCSGASALVYQVVWVRVFGNVFGNTIQSASLVVALFMLGLGVGSYLVGRWADRRYAVRPESLVRSYGYLEIGIALVAIVVSASLPRLYWLSGSISSYVQDANGWYVLSAASYAARAGVLAILLLPITTLMGGTLTLLIRFLVRSDVQIGNVRVAALYGINTVGAAAGCLVTDFAIVPFSGLRSAQMIAVILNIVAAAGAFSIASRALLLRTPADVAQPFRAADHGRSAGLEACATTNAPLTFVSLALALSGLAAMGMEILWFRHFTILLGGFRAVFATLLAIILIGIGAGSLLSRALLRRVRPVEAFMVVQALFVVSVLTGLAVVDASGIERLVLAAPSSARPVKELWFNLRPMLAGVALPALLMGFAFPLGNAIVQRTDTAVGRRAGLLYLANTIGAVTGSVAVGFLLLPMLGIQTSATVLALCAGLTLLPLYLGERREAGGGRRRGELIAGAAAAAIVVALAAWISLPSDYVLARALRSSDATSRVLATREGLNEVVTVTESPGKGRTLLTNGHPMSGTAPLAQRYMRALAHVPLLMIDEPERVLVIGFGVGNTTHAATLHPSVKRVEVADLSKDVLAHAEYFSDANHHVLNDPDVVVYVNDGRHHLQMQPDASYDVIALEPPPIGYAGVVSLYSREFYALARSRLRPRGYISQWLPAYQVPSETALSMVRAFLDVFPQAVLISGAESDLVLLGVKGSRIELDPEKVRLSLSNAPGVRADLDRVHLGTLREVIGTFVASAATLSWATRDVPAVTDDRPLQEYSVRSLLDFGEAVPGSLVDLTGLEAWCPRCFVDGRLIRPLEGLDTYLALLDRAYRATPAEIARLRALPATPPRVVDGSAYLGAVVPETADLHNTLGIALAEKGQIDPALEEFRQALRLDPGSSTTYWHLGAALASKGARDEALTSLQRSVQINPTNGRVQYDLALMYAQAGQFDAAVRHFRAALQLMPNSVETHDHLGRALVEANQLDEAIAHFEQALALDPGYAEAQRNLATARRLREERK